MAQLQDINGAQTLREAWPKLEGNDQALNADIANLQQQITAEQQNRVIADTSEQQARIAVDMAHQQSTTAHDASAITFMPGTSGLTSTKTDAAIKEVNGRVTNIITGGSVTKDAEVTDIRLGADGVARSSAGALTREIHAQQLASNIAQAMLKHGLNVVSVNGATPLNVTIQGRTLVNLLGKYGNFDKDSNGDGVADGWTTLNGTGSCSLSSVSSKYGAMAQRISALSTDTTQSRYVARFNMSFEVGKYYMLLVDTVTDGTTSAEVTVKHSASSSVTLTTLSSKVCYVKFAPSTTASDSYVALYNRATVGATGWVQFDGVRLYEIDAATYAKIDVDPEYTGDKLAERYPNDDSIQHIRNPVITKMGKNQIPPFTDPAWTVHANAAFTDPYKLNLNATAVGQVSYIDMPVLPNTQYTLSVSHNAYIAVYKTSASVPIVGYTTAASLSFNSGTETSVRVYLSNNTVATGTFTFSNPQLEFGSTATSFEARNDDYLYANTVLAGANGVYDTLTVRGTGAIKTKRWMSDVVLDGSLGWSFVNDYAGFKLVKYTGLATSLPDSLHYIAKYDGKPLTRFSAVPWQVDSSRIAGTSVNEIYISIADTDSGWSEDYTPTAAEIAAFYNGWQMNNGTLGTPYNSTGTKSWTALISPKADFSGKISGSALENPHLLRLGSNSATPAPGTITYEVATSDYAKVSVLDGSALSYSANTSGQIVQFLFSFNLIEHVIRKYGSAIFGAATDTTARVAWVKANIGKIVCNWFGYGLGPSGNKVTMNVWVNSTTSWSNTTVNHTNASVAKLAFSSNSLASLIDSNGFVHFIAYADASDGTTASAIYTDFVELEANLLMTTMPTFMPTSFTPYKLSYQLAKAVDEVVPIEGAIGLHAGGNQIEVGEGMIVREKAAPTLYQGIYYLNVTTTPSTQFKYRAQQIIAIYKNGIPDRNWIIETHAEGYGKQRAKIASANYDPTAEYTVTYIALDKYAMTTNVTDVTGEYQSSQKSIQDSIVKRLNDTETGLSSIVNAVAELYKRTKALGG